MKRLSTSRALRLHVNADHPAPEPPGHERPAPTIAAPAAPPLFERVVLAIDFGPVSLAAARWATTNVAPQSHAILSHVVPFPDGLGEDDEAEPDSRGDALRRMLPALAGGLGGFGATLDVATTRTALRVGRPSHWLARIANDGEASLVAVGRRQDANRTRIGEPNVIERLARRTSASFLVVPEGTREPPRQIIAAVDDSRFSSVVLRTAVRLAQIHACSLTLLHVVSPAIGAYDRVIRTARQVRGRRRRAEEAPRRLTPASFPARITGWLTELWRTQRSLVPTAVELAVGDPAREIAARAAERESPLVVVGQRGADDAPLGSIGSVARELLTRAPMPVLAMSAV